MILTPLGIAAQRSRDWILYTDETPTVPVYPEYSLEQTRAAIDKGEKPNYMGTYISAKNFILQSFTTTQSPRVKKRVSQFMQISVCPECHGKKLKKESLAVKFAGLDIGELSQLTLTDLALALQNTAHTKIKMILLTAKKPSSHSVLLAISSRALRR